MSLSLITSFQECAGTAKVPATRNIFLCPCPGVGEHLDSKRQSVQSECWALGPCNGGWRKRTLLDLVWSNDRKQRFQSSCRFGKVSPCLLWAACCQDFVLSWAVSFSQRMPVLPCEQPSYGLRDMEETSQHRSTREPSGQTGMRICSGVLGWRAAGPSPTRAKGRAQDCHWC